MTDTIFLIVGKSGSGKDTVVNRLVEKYGLHRLDSYTTRKRRNHEDKHVFVESIGKWQAQNQSEKIVGYTYFDGNHYWATKSQVEASDLYIIDPNGILYFRDKYDGDKDVKIVYLKVPAWKRFWRMMKRGDGVIAAASRIVHDHQKFSQTEDLCDIKLNDKSVDDAVATLWAYIKQ